MVFCDSKFEHIDKSEFESGRKITSNLLLRFCSNIRGLWDKTRKLEDSSDPELRKRFYPPVVHQQHSYGIRLNEENVYIFDNSTETIFEDGIGRKYITLRNFQKEKQNVWFAQLETVENIQEIRDSINDKLYTYKETISGVSGAKGTYHIDPLKKIVVCASVRGW